MEFNIETIKGLQEGGTYVVEFPEDMPIENCIHIAQQLNQQIKDNHRDIVFIYLRKGDADIKGAWSYEL